MIKKIEVHPLIAYDRLQDLRAIKSALDYLQMYVDYKRPDFKTFGDQNLKWAIERLENRIIEREMHDKQG